LNAFENSTADSISATFVSYRSAIGSTIQTLRSCKEAAAAVIHHMKSFLFHQASPRGSSFAKQISHSAGKFFPPFASSEGRWALLCVTPDIVQKRNQIFAGMAMISPILWR
jgi:hypothetical protein